MGRHWAPGGRDRRRGSCSLVRRKIDFIYDLMRATHAIIPPKRTIELQERRMAGADRTGEAGGRANVVLNAQRRREQNFA